MKRAINILKKEALYNDKIYFGITGFNTFPYQGHLVKYKPRLYNGGQDSFLIKRKYLKSFIQEKWYEKTSFGDEIQGYQLLSGLHL